MIGLRFAKFGVIQFDEARTKSVRARIILVARRLVDTSLASVRRRERLDGDAVRLHRTIAAALAYAGIDIAPALRIGQSAALAPPPLFARACLFVTARSTEDGRVGKECV